MELDELDELDKNARALIGINLQSYTSIEKHSSVMVRVADN